MKKVRYLGGLVWILFACAGWTQVRTSTPAADPIDLSDAADLRDDVLIRSVLESHLSVDDIYKSKATQEFVLREADEIVAASQRRIKRAEARLEAARTALPGGQDPQKTLAPMFDEVQNRIRAAYDVLDRSTILKDVVQSARLQASPRSGKGPVMTRYDGNHRFSPADIEIVSRAFERRFRRPLPVSADGQTSLHRALGFDHRGRVDVALSPDQTEGLWLCNYLRTLRIPYYAFRKAVPGSATSAHIHIGPGSTRLHSSALLRSDAPPAA